MASNAPRSTKWYSLPSVSLGRGGRVVCETLKVRPRAAPRSLSLSVVFPAPLGDDRIRSRKSSLDILHLLAHPLDLRLHLDDGVRDRRVGALGADGVRLARHLLQEKIEAAADRFAAREEPGGLRGGAGAARGAPADGAAPGAGGDPLRE